MNTEQTSENIFMHNTCHEQFNIVSHMKLLTEPRVIHDTVGRHSQNEYQDNH